MAHRASRSDDVRTDDGGEIDLAALGRGLWRLRLWIIGPTVLAALAALAFVLLSSPYYRSGAMILIENREGGGPRSGAAEREAPLPDEQAVVSQVQLIKSRDLVRAVVAALGLDKAPEFAEPSVLERLFRAVGFRGAQEGQPQNEQVVDRVAANLSVFPVAGSRVIGVEFVSTDPDLAARTANVFADAYLDTQRDAKREMNKQASRYLADEIASLRGRVSEAEGRVERFRAKADLLVGTNNTTVVAQQLGDASNQLSTARTQQAEAQAKADVIRSVLKSGRPAEALEIANSELVRALAQQRSQLAAQIASEGRTLLAQHPRMRELRAQFGGLDAQIRTEAEKLARAFENDARTAGGRVAALNKQLEQLKGKSATANNQDVDLRALEREARSQRDLLEQMLTRYREASSRENPEALLADARVIARASAATKSYFPKKIPTVALSALAAFVLSLFAVAVAEVFGDRPRLADGRVEPLPSRPIAQPDEAAAPSAAASDEYPAMAVHEAIAKTAAAPTPVAEESAAAEPAAPKPAAAKAGAGKIEYADAALVSALARQLAAVPTSSGAIRMLAMGATRDVQTAAVAAKLAATISEQGKRVVAVDAAAGAPGEAGPGLSELLRGETTFAQAIHRDRGSRVHVVPEGATPFLKLESDARARLAMVLEALALTYDFVIVTTPNEPGGAEPFAAHCGAAVLVSNAGADDAATIAAHDRLKATGIEDVVVVLLSGGDGAPEGSSLAA